MLTRGETADGHENEAAGQDVASVLSGHAVYLGEDFTHIRVEEEESKQIAAFRNEESDDRSRLNNLLPWQRRQGYWFLLLLVAVVSTDTDTVADVLSLLLADSWMHGRRVSHKPEPQWKPNETE